MAATSAAATGAKSTDTKTFILNHMNTSHQDSLALYLRVYNRVPTNEAKFAHLEDISLSDLVITAKGTRYTVPIDPPMKTLSEARGRVVSMHKHCLQQLGLSEITVKEYRPPRGFHAIVFSLCVATFIGFFRRANFLPGSLIHDVLGVGRIPSFARFCYTIQPVLFPVVVGIHALEAVLLVFKRLRPYRVPAFSRLWVLWVLSNFIEGFGAWVRFDRIVKEEREKQDGGKRE